MKRLLLTALLALGLATPALAHRGHDGLTVVEVEAVSGAVSVVHRFSAHDVEPALVSIAPEAQPSLDDPAAVAALEAHLAGRFRIEVDGRTVSLTRTATDLAGDNIRIGFSGQAAPAPVVHQVTVDLDFFPGVHDDQEQQVNIRTGGVTRTLVFRPGDGARTVHFQP